MAKPHTKKLGPYSSILVDTTILGPVKIYSLQRAPAFDCYCKSPYLAYLVSGTKYWLEFKATESLSGSASATPFASINMIGNDIVVKYGWHIEVKLNYTVTGHLIPNHSPVLFNGVDKHSLLCTTSKAATQYNSLQQHAKLKYDLKVLAIQTSAKELKKLKKEYHIAKKAKEIASQIQDRIHKQLKKNYTNKQAKKILGNRVP